VQIRLDGILVVDYTEASPPVIPPGPETARFIDRGQFALQCHKMTGNCRNFELVNSLTIGKLPVGAGAVG